MVKPIISVVMSVYAEKEDWLRKSITSILIQSYSNFEFIIILDNPQNLALLKILNEYKKKDSRIIILINDKNRGLAYSLNRGIDLAKGEFIARMDGDDISASSRFKDQISFLNKNKNIDFLFTQINFIDEDGTKTGETFSTEEEYSHIQKTIFKGMLIMPHPSVMIRSKVLKELKYDVNCIRSQDLELWLRALSQGYEFQIIEKKLLSYRIESSMDKRISKNKTWALYRLKIYSKLYFSYFSNIWFHYSIIRTILEVILYLLPKVVIKKLMKIKSN